MFNKTDSLGVKYNVYKEKIQKSSFVKGAELFLKCCGYLGKINLDIKEGF